MSASDPSSPNDHQNEDDEAQSSHVNQVKRASNPNTEDDALPGSSGVPYPQTNNFIPDSDRRSEWASDADNMALVHEIALNQEFKIGDSPNHTLVKHVKECLRKAFWDNFQKSFDQESGSGSSEELRLLKDIKEMLLDLLDDRLIRFRNEIEFLLGECHLRQKIESNCFHSKELLMQILDVISRLCAPARDEEVANLRQTVDIFAIYRGICELLEAMKLDMANFTLKEYRPIILEYASTYEWQHFEKILAHNPSLEVTVIEWLKEHVFANDKQPTPSSSSAAASELRFEALNNSEVSDMISRAYMELLEWNDSKALPTTLLLDESRIKDVKNSYYELTVASCCLTVCFNFAGKQVITAHDFKTSLKNDLFASLKGVTPRNLSERIQAIFTLSDVKVTKMCADLKCGTWTEDIKQGFRISLNGLLDNNNAVLALIRKRLYTLFFAKVSLDSMDRLKDILVRFSEVREEILPLINQFVRIVSYNRHVYGTYYGRLIRKILSEKSSFTTPCGP